ncbi:MAG: hypothetical protein CMF31_01010 [Kordiimonas sp.]|nr:hypothetical protein [Kordiimonas sp.]|tara:strand:- start:101 stop:1324 length:1224 start_codon:yes stop_codon:yes gene_type:complete
MDETVLSSGERNKTGQIDGQPTMGELMAAARDMLPTLRERARQCEELRRVPEETIQEFQDAGFFKILQPAEFGGYELWPQALYRVCSIVAQACPSSAWVLSVIVIHNWEMGVLPREASVDVWAEDEHVRISSSYAPFGEAVPVEGGYKVSGRWHYSSGCDHCDWAFLGSLLKEEGKPPRLIASLVPRKDYVIDDTWHVSGLAGTGSKDIVVEEAFVPDHCVHVLSDEHAKGLRDRPYFDGPAYQVPFYAAFGYCLTSIPLGIARGAYEYYVEMNQSRRNAFDGSSYKKDPLNQQRLAEAWAILDGCELKFERDMADMQSYVEKGEEIPLEKRAMYRWNQAYIAKACTEAVTILFKAAGARATYLDNPMQRFFRDINSASNHYLINADAGATSFGEFQLTGAYPNGAV